jgi:hypothetical protein
MTYFQSSEDFYDHVGGLIEQVLSDEKLGPTFSGEDMVVRFEHTDPDAAVTVVLRRGEPGSAQFGRSEIEPDVTMSMPADIAHRFWLGRVNVPVALVRGEIVASGEIERLLRLVPLATPAFTIYRSRLLAQDRRDLVEA